MTIPPQNCTWVGGVSPVDVRIMNEAMQNALARAFPAEPRYPRIDPTKPMSDKAAHLLSINGFLKEA